MALVLDLPTMTYKCHREGILYWVVKYSTSDNGVIGRDYSADARQLKTR